MVGKKRGRKPNATQSSIDENTIVNEEQTQEQNNLISNTTHENNINTNENTKDTSIPKKRGRKPKGGKLIETSELNEEIKVLLPNVIVHFKCKIEDLIENMNNNEANDYINEFSKYTIIDDTYNHKSTQDDNIINKTSNIKNKKSTKKSKNIKNEVIPNDAMDYVKAHDLGFSYINDTTTLEMTDETSNNNFCNNHVNNYSNCNNNNSEYDSKIRTNNNAYQKDSLNVFKNVHNNTRTSIENKLYDEAENIEVNNKIREMEVNFHNNNLNGKRSACFWDTCPFDTPAFYIPKSIDNDTVRPYGCFCSLNCALAYLHNEDIDSSTKFERRQLLFNLYSEVIGDKTFIKPSPNPRYSLDKYYGNLTIQQWRSLLAGDRMLLIVDKPLTPELPELHTETTDRFVTMGSVNNNTEVAQYGKFKIRKAAPKQSKGAIVAEKFGITTGK